MAWERSVDTGNHSVYLGEGWLLFSCYCVQLFVTPWTAPHQTSLSFSISQSLLKLMSIESMMPSNHIIPCRCLLLLPSTFPSMGVCCSESALCIKCPKDWKLSFCISLYNEYSGLISFRIDWLDLLAVHGTLKSLQHHSLKLAALQCSASLWSSSHIHT